MQNISQWVVSEDGKKVNGYTIYAPMTFFRTMDDFDRHAAQHGVFENHTYCIGLSCYRWDTTINQLYKIGEISQETYDSATQDSLTFALITAKQCEDSDVIAGLEGRIEELEIIIGELEEANQNKQEQIEELEDEIRRLEEIIKELTPPPVYEADLDITIQLLNRTYPGEDLSIRHADEISGYPSVWHWMQARIRAANWSGINIKDYIPFMVGTELMLAEVAGIDTYYNYGEEGNIVPHHIDFISRECLETAYRWNAINYNNGIEGVPCPWMCSEIRARLNNLSYLSPSNTSGGTALVDFTTTGIFSQLPQDLQSVIVEKHAYIEERFSSGNPGLAQNTGGSWQNIGKLWLPSEVGVCGRQIQGTQPEPDTSVHAYGDMGYIQYPLFAGKMNRIKKRIYALSAHWWSCSVFGSNSVGVIACDSDGSMVHYSASSAVRIPICFRIT